METITTNNEKEKINRFISISKNAIIPQFSYLTTLTINEHQTSWLIDFVMFLMKGKYTSMESQGGKCEVISKRGVTYVFTMYNMGVLKTKIGKENKRVFYMF